MTALESNGSFLNLMTVRGNKGVMGLGYAREEDPSNEGNEPVVDPPSDEPMVLADVTFPSDVLKPTSTRSPAGEGVQGLIDNNADTKYLNFDKLNTGFTVQLFPVRWPWWG